MLDQMSMPVLFALLISVLVVVSVGATLVYRLVFEHNSSHHKATRSRRRSA